MSRNTLALQAQLTFCEYLQDIVNKEELKVCIIFVYQLILSNSNMTLDIYANKLSQEINIDLSDVLAQFKTTDKYMALLQTYPLIHYTTIYPKIKAHSPPNIVNIYSFCNYMRLSNLSDNIIYYMYNKLDELKESSIELNAFIIEIEKVFSINLTANFLQQYSNFKQLDSMMDPIIVNKINEKYIVSFKSLSPLAAVFVPKMITVNQIVN